MVYLLFFLLVAPADGGPPPPQAPPAHADGGPPAPQAPPAHADGGPPAHADGGPPPPQAPPAHADGGPPAHADGGPPAPQALNRTSQVLMRRVHSKQNYLRLPVVVDSDVSLVGGGHFSPVRSSSVSRGPVRTSCERNMMRVQVGRRIFGAGEPDSHLRLGTCRVSRSTEDHLYFEYELSMCGTKRTVVSNRMVYFNVLHYDPPAPQGPVRRTAPFSLPVGCYFNRYLYSYTAAHTPEVQMQKVFKETQKADKFILTARTARWEKLSPSDRVMLGEPLYVEAEAPALSPGQRLYVHTCFVTPDKSHTSTPQVSVVKHFGCAVKREDSVSKFIPYRSNVVRLSVDSSLLRGLAGQLYMHCNMSAGSLLPTPTAKSCSYNTTSKRWEELSGFNSVCDCCDSCCSSAAPTVTQIFSSGPWLMEHKVKRRIPSLPRNTASIMKAPPPPEMKGWKRRSWPEKEAEIVTAEKTLTELEWPFVGGGVMWSEEEDEEEQVKGSVAMEADEELKVQEPHRIFEDVFIFDE